MNSGQGGSVGRPGGGDADVVEPLHPAHASPGGGPRQGLTARTRHGSVILMNAPLVIPSEPTTADGATPVMAQYFDAKARQPDALIFFRMGDFYELFFEDAAKAAVAIGITLTHRGTHAGQPIPMAGVPAHAAEAYLA